MTAMAARTLGYRVHVLDPDPECAASPVADRVVAGKFSDADAAADLARHCDVVTLEIEHNHYFHSVMQGCRRLSNSRPEIDGLDHLLMVPEQHLHDVAIERERRRSRQGYATPADARAFLQMARQPRAASARADWASADPWFTGA